MRASDTSLIGAALAVGSATFYGINIVIARLITDAGINGVAFVFYRTVVVIVGLLALAYAWRASLRVARARWGVTGVLVATSIGISVCYISAIVFVPVTVAAVIFYTFPVLIVLASPFVEGRRLTVPLLAIAAVAFLGVALVVGPAYETLDWRGVGLAFLAAIAAAAQFFAGVRARDVPILTKVFWMNLGTLPASIAIAVVFGVMTPPEDLALAPILVGLGVVVFVAAFILQFLALARATAVATGLAFCIEPVVAAFGAALLVGERLDLVQIGGVALVIAAIAGNVLIDTRAAPTRGEAKRARGGG